MRQLPRATADGNMAESARKPRLFSFVPNDDQGELVPIVLVVMTIVMMSIAVVIVTVMAAVLIALADGAPAGACKTKKDRRGEQPPFGVRPHGALGWDLHGHYPFDCGG